MNGTELITWPYQAAKQDAVNAIALPEIELRRRARGASVALLSRLAGLSAAPAGTSGTSISSSSGGGGGHGGGGDRGYIVAAAATAGIGGGRVSPGATSPSGGVANTSGGSGAGPAARLAETCAALTAWPYTCDLSYQHAPILPLKLLSLK